MLVFNLQLFGKKKSKVIQTDAKVPQASAEEKQLMNEALGYLQMNKPITEKLLGLANGSLGGQFTPNYQDIYNKLQSDTARNQGLLNGLLPNVQQAGDETQNANRGYLANMGNSINQYQEGNKYLDNEYKQATDSNRATMQGLMNGELPSQYAENRRKALQDDLQGTVGNALSTLADRGIVNSSVSTSALNDISRNASNALANAYTQDMHTATGIANSAFGNQMQGLNGRAGLLGDNFRNAMTGYGQQAGLTNQNYANALNNATTQAGLINQSQQMATQPLANATASQEASFYSPAKYLEMALSSQAPHLNLLNSMRQQRYSMGTPGQTVVKQGSGGLFGGLVQGIGMGLACFPKGTSVSTIYGSKNIEDLTTEDILVSYKSHTPVLEVREMGEEPIYEIKTTNCNVLTTPTQVFMTRDGAKQLTELNAGEFIDTVNSYESIVSIEDTGRVEPVYDVIIANDGYFYAGGILVESLTQKDIEDIKSDDTEDIIVEDTTKQEESVQTEEETPKTEDIPEKKTTRRRVSKKGE